jgi:hypothetical protein
VCIVELRCVGTGCAYLLNTRKVHQDRPSNSRWKGACCNSVSCCVELNAYDAQCAYLYAK